MQENEYLDFLSKHGYELTEKNLITLIRFLEAIIAAAKNVADSEAPVREAVKSISMEFIDGSTMLFPDPRQSIPTFIKHKGKMVSFDDFSKED